MGFVRVLKNSSYFSRQKLRFRRRRQRKTDYAQRRQLIIQDKRKYNVPKWRLVVRMTNKDVICQIVCAKAIGDEILCAAYSHELPRYGVKVGLTNYPACYCTGLLLARRLLRKLGLDKYYRGKKLADGKMFKSHISNINWKEGESRRPFRCFLDIGLRRATTGARVFGCLKGAVDGGLDVPHSDRRFPGFKWGSKETGTKTRYHYDKHRKKIFGSNVGNYMRYLAKNDSDKLQKQFGKYIKAGIGPEMLKTMYEKAHKMIRDDPAPAPKSKKDLSKMKIYRKPQKTSYEEKKRQIQEKIRKAKAGMDAMEEDSQVSDQESDSSE